MEIKNICQFSDILYFAKQKGYIWNEAVKIFDKLRPQYEIYQRTIYLDDFYKRSNMYGFADKELRLIRSFFKKNKTDEILIVRDK